MIVPSLLIFFPSSLLPVPLLYFISFFPVFSSFPVSPWQFRYFLISNVYFLLATPILPYFILFSGLFPFCHLGGVTTVVVPLSFYFNSFLDFPFFFSFSIFHFLFPLYCFFFI
ncbi:hypothetical protein L873DRAFT_869996 [Choiromyces venosus 120613-1]|uniref:Uncharacterized protein n=1 Tax=Choiromyces venosus 120613-1 TaxID=1336337 RepID=A0A3N4IWX8_9PEZI|nr:hypothetical protein L873DRAFT_869996 [Choiromyces venosus 120613-1]